MSQRIALTDQKRASIALIFIISGSSLSYFSSDKLQIVARVILLLIGFIILLPVLIRKYKHTKHWKIFVLIATAGTVLYLTDAVFQLFDK